MKVDKRQIKELLEKTRAGYLELVAISPKFSRLGDSFEERHRLTIMNGLDELSFLSEEYNYIRSLVAKKQTEKELSEARTMEVNDSVIDAELSKYAQRIERYPEMNLPGSNHHTELSRLFGALSVIDREYWGAIEKFLRERYPIRAKSPMETLSQQFMHFIGAGSRNIPPILTYYCDSVERGDVAKADDLAFGVTKDVAFFLNDVISILNKEGYDYNDPAYKYMRNVLEDFRLTEIKRRRF